MPRLLFGILFILITGFQTSASDFNWKHLTEDPEYIHRAIKKVTDVIVYDIYSPPVASRTYAYITIAGYEAAVPASHEYQSMSGQLNGLKPLTKAAPSEYSPTISAVQAILSVAKTMVISEKQIIDFHSEMLQEFRRSGIPESVYESSVEHGNNVAKHIIAWAATDQYRETRAMPRYYLSDADESWKPTPPAYMKAIEPHWSKMRPFALDSSTQFKPVPPTPFSSDKNSQFYKEAMEVYKVVSTLSEEQRDIAAFWDCNPFKMNVNGHVMYATKKISPGGHWINITALACKKVKAGVMRSLESYACISIALADAFISCWDEKYRSNVIRPETYINQYIDGNWMPLLQTPPFPEYTSGHSIVSKASSVLLTKLFGDHFSYADSTELEFGLPVRHFKSFSHAAEEAAISRLYGGIHYRPAIENGFKEGEKLALFIAGKLQTRKEGIGMKNPNE